MPETQPPAPIPKTKSSKKAAKPPKLNAITIEVRNGKLNVQVKLNDRTPRAIGDLIETLSLLSKGKMRTMIAHKFGEAAQAASLDDSDVLVDYLAKSGPKVKPSEATGRLLANLDE